MTLGLNEIKNCTRQRQRRRQNKNLTQRVIYKPACNDETKEVHSVHQDQ